MALTEEQKRLRAEAYGASEVATVVGKGFGKLSDLFESKVNPTFNDDEDLDDMLPAELGTLEEDPVAKVYARRTGTFLHAVNTLRHPTRPLAVATPDRARFISEDAWRRAAEKAGATMLGADQLEEADRLVEVKTHAARYRKDYGPAGTGQIPEHEAIQTTWQMGVTGLRVVDLPVLFRGDWGVKVETFTVTFNQDVFDWLYDSVQRFHHDYVLARKPPPPDGSEAYSEMMQRLHAVARKAHVTADESDDALILRWAQLAEVEKRAGKYKELVGQQLMQRIGGAGGLLSAKLGKLSWISVRESSQVNWQQAANEAMRIAGLCANAFRVLRDVNEIPSEENLQKLEVQIKNIVPDATKPKAGYRYLKLFPQGDAQLENARLQIALDSLEEGS